MYQPKYEIAQISEKAVKIVNAGQEEDFIGDWFNSWDLDHKNDAAYDGFKVSATSVYFVEENKEVLFT